MNREEIEKLLTEWEQYKIPRLYEGGAIDVMRLLINEFASINQDSFLPPAEGAEAQRCPVCMGKGLVPNSFYATTIGIGSTTQTYLPEKCRTCNGAGVILPSYLQKQQQPTAEGAEAFLDEMELGEPLQTGEFYYRSEVLEAMNKFATLHAQRIADKKYADTEADGYVFCGKCGKMKEI